MKLKSGQEILFKIPEASQENFKGEVHVVGTSIDPKSRVTMVHGHIDEKTEANFSVGMFVEAIITTETFTQPALPDDAVVELDGKHFILQLESEDVNGYQLHPVEVKVETSYNGYTSFKTPLDPKATFLTKGGFVLLQGEDSGGIHINYGMLFNTYNSVKTHFNWSTYSEILYWDNFNLALQTLCMLEKSI